MLARVEHELELLQAARPGVVVHRDPSGQHLIELPMFPLSPGWSKPTTTALFRLPPAYPEARPDNFWSEGDLRLATGGMPTNCSPSSERLLGREWLLYSWHVTQWAPGKDDLLTYVGVIARRFELGQ